MGVDPGPLTLRTLVRMATGHGKAYWQRTAILACLIANANRDPKKRRRPFSPSDFNPYAVRKRASGGIRVCKANRGLLKKIKAGGSGGV